MTFITLYTNLNTVKWEKINKRNIKGFLRNVNNIEIVPPPCDDFEIDKEMVFNSCSYDDFEIDKEMIFVSHNSCISCLMSGWYRV